MHARLSLSSAPKYPPPQLWTQTRNPRLETQDPKLRNPRPETCSVKRPCFLSDHMTAPLCRGSQQKPAKGQSSSRVFEFTETQNPKPETRNTKPETRNSNPQNRNPSCLPTPWELNPKSQTSKLETPLVSQHPGVTKSDLLLLSAVTRGLPVWVAAAERGGTNFKGFEDFHLKARTRFCWPESQDQILVLAVSRVPRSLDSGPWPVT